MLRFFRRMLRRREIYFHEDDCCQQQLLPREAATCVDAELKKITEFADAHRAPDGIGWTAIYMRQESPAELRTLRITLAQFAARVSPILPPYDAVYTGYSSRRELCRNTAAWGRSAACAIFADWNEEGVITDVWTSFFDRGEASILAASRAVTAIGDLHQLVYVDWAWGYACDATDENAFATPLRIKLQTISENTRVPEKG